MSTKTVIKVTGLSKYFDLGKGQRSLKAVFTGIFRKDQTVEKGGFWALKDINIEVKHGEFLGIVGRNGSGKSTLLKILAGVYSPTEGNVEISGRLVPFIELGVGFNPELSGRDNVYLNGALLGFSRPEMNEMYDDIVSFAELEDHMDVKLKNYSSGMQVRLAFSVAIRAESDILLLDEVLAVGDANFQKKCFAYFEELKKQKKTVVFISHEVSAVEQYCDRVVIIDNARVQESPKDVDKTLSQYLTILDPSRGVSTTLKRGVEDKASSEPSEVSLDLADVQCDLDSVIIRYSLKKQTSAADHFYTAFSIRDGLDRVVAGTNTQIHIDDSDLFKVGSSSTVAWKLKNVFSEGEYSVNVAVFTSDEDKKVTFSNVAKFRSERPKNYMSIDPVIDVTVD